MGQRSRCKFDTFAFVLLAMGSALCHLDWRLRTLREYPRSFSNVLHKSCFISFIGIFKRRNQLQGVIYILPWKLAPNFTPIGSLSCSRRGHLTQTISCSLVMSPVTWQNLFSRSRVFYSFLPWLDTTIPTLSLNIPNTERGHCAKTMAIINYLASFSRAQQNPPSWYIIADDDTILRYFVSCLVVDIISKLRPICITVLAGCRCFCRVTMHPRHCLSDSDMDMPVAIVMVTITSQVRLY